MLEEESVETGSQESVDGGNHGIDKFAEYRFFTASTEKLTDRRQTASQVWVTLHTLLFAALGFLLKESGVESWQLIASVAPLLVLGILSCWVWRKMLLSYRALIGWRYEQLMQIEKSPEMRGTHGFFTREWNELFAPEARTAKLSFTQLEAWLPIILLCIYLGFGVVAALLAFGQLA